MLTRRQTLTLAPGAVLHPSIAVGQQVARPARHVGVILTAGSNSPVFTNFRDELARLGYVEGQDVRIEARFAGGRNELLPGFAAEVVAAGSEVIVVVGAVTVRAVRQVSATIPVVFTIVLDPVVDGLVTSADKPGGNTTGVTNFDAGQARDQIRLLKQILPALTRVAVLGDAGVPDLLERANQAAAEAEGLRAQLIRLRGARDDMDAVFAAIRQENAGAVLGLEVPAVFLHTKTIVARATQSKLPTMFAGDWAVFGPMLAYGTSVVSNFECRAKLGSRGCPHLGRAGELQTNVEGRAVSPAC